MRSNAFLSFTVMALLFSACGNQDRANAETAYAATEAAGAAASGNPVFEFSRENDFVVSVSDGGITITDYRGASADPRIPPTIQGLPVTGFGSQAFAGRYNAFVDGRWTVRERFQLTSVTVPGTVTFIDSAAFQGNQLTYLTIPASVSHIGSSAFQSNQLKTVTIPSSITEIASLVFYNNQLARVNIPNSVTSIGSHAFANNQLQHVDIPDSVTRIERRAFAGNRLVSITLPANATSIEEEAFADNQLTSLSVGGRAVSVASAAFGWAEFESLTFGDKEVRIGDLLLSQAQLDGVNLRDGFTHIGDLFFGFSEEFEAAQGFTARFIVSGGSAGVEITGQRGTSADLRIPAQVRDMPVISIGERAFAGRFCHFDGIWERQFTSVIIPDSVIRIGEGAFADNLLTSVNIPNSVIYLGGFENNQIASIDIPESVIQLGGFAGNHLTVIEIPNSVIHISEGAFAGNRLSYVEIPGSVRHIGRAAFWDNSMGQSSVSIPDSVISYSEAFDWDRQ